MYNSAGAELPFTNFNGQRRYNVSKGQTVQVEFTYENNGESYQNPNVGYYISSDSTISTADTLIATASYGLGRADVLTAKRSLTIPSTLISGGTYYLGGIADWNNVITEVNSANNAAYHIISIN